jgi:hypothetical protein
MRFAALQERLPAVSSLHRAGARTPHVWIVLPSFSVADAPAVHNGAPVGPLEHRSLVAALGLAGVEAAEMVFVSCQSPDDAVLDHYFGFVPPDQRDDARRRFRMLVVDDPSPRPVAAKLLERPDLLSGLRASLAGRPAFIDPWQVTAVEVDLAVALGAPVRGPAPDVWALGFKSAGRRLFAALGVPHPVGVQDVHSVDDAVAAALAIRWAQPQAEAVVIKHDDGGGGNGNAVVPVADLPVDPEDAEVILRGRLGGLSESYRAELKRGGIVEELITGDVVASPSVQVDISPAGHVAVVSTHEQVLGGPAGQTYTGCRFPANPAYAGALARYGGAVGHELRRRGVVGQFGVDFVATAERRRWRLHALEVNLRKGGTTHPFGVLRHLVPDGRYHPATGTFAAPDGPAKHYRATDSLADPAWVGLPPPAVVAALERAGLVFDRRRGTGVVLHMLSALAGDGRLGLTAVGDSDDEAAELVQATAAALSGAAGQTPVASRASMATSNHSI